MANVAVPYEDFKEMSASSKTLENALNILNTEFPDDTCQLIALKAVLEKKEETSDDTTGTP